MDVTPDAYDPRADTSVAVRVEPASIDSPGYVAASVEYAAVLPPNATIASAAAILLLGIFAETSVETSTARLLLFVITHNTMAISPSKIFWVTGIFIPYNVTEEPRVLQVAATLGA